MTIDARHVIEHSRSRKELVAAALTLARSRSSQDHDLLADALESADFLGRLDSEHEYEAERRLRVWRVLEDLARNPAPAAGQVLTRLTQSPVFNQVPARTDRLIEVCAELRPPPAQVVNFWDEHCKPDDGFTPLTIDALVHNGTRPALGLLERKLADQAHEEAVRVAWLRTTVLLHRNDPLLLESSERMLASDLAENLRAALVEVLFDYRPLEWHGDSVDLTPPDRNAATPEAVGTLHRIGRFALEHMSLTEEQQGAVEKTLSEMASGAVWE